MGYEADDMGWMSDRVAGHVADRAGDNGDSYRDIGKSDEARIDQIADDQEYTGEEWRRPPKPTPLPPPVKAPPLTPGKVPAAAAPPPTAGTTPPAAVTPPKAAA